MTDVSWAVDSNEWLSECSTCISTFSKFVHWFKLITMIIHFYILFYLCMQMCLCKWSVYVQILCICIWLSLTGCVSMSISCVFSMNVLLSCRPVKFRKYFIVILGWPFGRLALSRKRSKYTNKTKAVILPQLYCFDYRSLCAVQVYR